MEELYNKDCHPREKVGVKESWYSAENDMRLNAKLISEEQIRTAEFELKFHGIEIINEENNQKYSLFPGGIYDTTFYGIAGGTVIFNVLKIKNEIVRKTLPTRDLTIFSPTKKDMEKVKKRLRLEEIN